MLLTSDQELEVIKAFKAGVDREASAERFDCSVGMISRVLVKAGLAKPWGKWRPEVVDEVVRLVESHCHTCQTIADTINEKFQTDYTREAVSGKIHRLGLSNKLKKGAPPREKRSQYIVKPVITEIISLVPEADALNITLFELERGMCHWPTGDKRYCGYPTEGTRHSYCDKHRKAGTTPAKYSIFSRRSVIR